MDNRFLKFHGFHPSDFTRSFLNEKISAIQDEAPYGSTLQATFTRKDHVFKGVVIIYSSAGKFFAVASGSKLKDVTQRLVQQIRRKLDRWRSQRFAHESLTDLSHNENGLSEEVSYDANNVA